MVSKSTEKREEILKAAYKVFGSRGFKSTTVKAIALEAGIAAGSLYTYFKNKEDLFRSTVQQGWSRFLAEIQVIVSSPLQLPERFATILEYCFASLKSALPLLRGMLFEAQQRHLLQESLEKLCALLEGLFLEGRRKGLLTTTQSEENLQLLIRLIVFGVLLSASLIPEQALDEEILALKQGLTRSFQERLRLGESR